jgi:HD-like signal output (HDOD) protein/CheY-like chemotaxis protein
MRNEKKMRILFVDDEPMILEVIKFTLESMADRWEMVFVESGVEALGLMAQRPFDVVVTDMRMPDMSGAQLLIEVMKRYPATVRIILSAYSEEDLLIKCVGATHQYLAKPLELAALSKAIGRVANFRSWLPSQQIRQTLLRKDFLPSIPAVYLQIIEALQTPNCEIQHIGELVATDPGLTAKLLQLANSAFIGFAREVSSAEEAVMLLGIGTVRSLALAAPVFSSFDSLEVQGFSLEEVWTHSLRVGHLARMIARMEGATEEVLEQTFTAGVLHDVGKALLADNPALDYGRIVTQARKTGRSLIEAEREAYQVTHAQVGACLLDLWGLPAPLVEGVALHHTPAESCELAFNPLTAVYVANNLEHNSSTPDEQLLNRLDVNYLEQLHLDQRVEEWERELAVE